MIKNDAANSVNSSTLTVWQRKGKCLPGRLDHTREYFWLCLDSTAGIGKETAEQRFVSNPFVSITKLSTVSPADERPSIAVLLLITPLGIACKESWWRKQGQKQTRSRNSQQLVYHLIIGCILASCNPPWPLLAACSTLQKEIELAVTQWPGTEFSQHN